MDLAENMQKSLVNSSKINRFRHAISEIHDVSEKRKRFRSDSTVLFMPLDDVTKEKFEKLSDKHLSANEISISHHEEIKITPEEDPIVYSTMKMHPVNAWIRRSTPGFITCHQVWLAIHALITIALCVLYFLRIILVSAGILSICELLFGVLVRNEIFIAVLHCLVAFIPYLKYECNRMLHCIGGLHVSSAVAAFFWLLISLSCEQHGLGVQITGGFILFFILSLSLTAIPIIRRRFHNTFEHVHRYIGWTALITLIIHVIFLEVDKFDRFTAAAIFNAPVFILIVILIIIILPWICVRKVLVQFEQPSKDLTIITFSRALYPYGSTTRISFDGHEWHTFAIALTDPCADEHSILVAAVGDWTKNLAENYRANRLPKHVWIRKIKGLGFMYSIHAYRKVLIVCTGSGIAPALPYIKDPIPTTHTHLLWIAKNHAENYGKYI